MTGENETNEPTPLQTDEAPSPEPVDEESFDEDDDELPGFWSYATAAIVVAGAAAALAMLLP